MIDTRWALALAGACVLASAPACRGKDSSDELAADDAKATLERYVAESYCKNLTDLDDNGCEKPKVGTTTSVKVSAPTEREIGAEISFTSRKGARCKDDLSAKFSKTASGWVLSRAEGMPGPAADGARCILGAWGTPKSFELAVPKK